MPTDSPHASTPLCPSAGIEEIQVVGPILDIVVDQLGVCTEARSVWLHPDVVRHIRQQRIAKRRPIATGDAEFSLQHLPATILRPDYCGLDRRDVRRRRIDLVRGVPGTGRFLFASIKLVAGTDTGTSIDEIWVCTAHPLPSGFLTQGRYRDTLQPVRRTRA